MGGGGRETIDRLADLIQQTLLSILSPIVQTFILTTDCQYLHQELFTDGFANVFQPPPVILQTPVKLSIDYLGASLSCPNVRRNLVQPSSQTQVKILSTISCPLIPSFVLKLPHYFLYLLVFSSFVKSYLHQTDGKKC